MRCLDTKTADPHWYSGKKALINPFGCRRIFQRNVFAVVAAVEKPNKKRRRRVGGCEPGFAVPRKHYVTGRFVLRNGVLFSEPIFAFFARTDQNNRQPSDTRAWLSRNFTPASCARRYDRFRSLYHMFVLRVAYNKRHFCGSKLAQNLMTCPFTNKACGLWLSGCNATGLGNNERGTMVNPPRRRQTLALRRTGVVSISNETTTGPKIAKSMTKT